MKTFALQKDLFSEIKPGFAELVEKKLGKNRDRLFGVGEVAEVLRLSRKRGLEMIGCGRLPAANINKGMGVPVDAGRPTRGMRPLRPLWRMSYDAIAKMAEAMEEGV